MMVEDIRKWSDGRYTLMFDEHTFFVFDNEKEKRMTALQVTKKLNEKQVTISALKEENEHLQESYEICKKMLSETIEENELLECKLGVYNVHRLKKDYEQLKKENEKIQEEIKELKIERDDWKSSTCSYMKKDSILSMDCQIIQEALWELEKEIEFGSKREDLFFDLKEKFEKLNNHRIGVYE